MGDSLIYNAVMMAYVLAIFSGVAALTISMITGKKGRETRSRAFNGFVLAMLIMCIYDFAIYYSNYVIGSIGNTSLLRLGSCLIAIIFSLWLRLESRIVMDEKLGWYNRIVKIYACSYAVFWAALVFVVPKETLYGVKWLLLVSDIALGLLLLVGSVSYMSQALLKNQRHRLVFMFIVSSMLMWNFCSYFWGETSVYWGNSEFIREPLDFTIIFWLITNFNTLVYVYKYEFKKKYEDDGATRSGLEQPVITAAAAVESLGQEFMLTQREMDIAKLIYEGHSNLEISGKLYISESTVKTHIYNIFRKLEINSRGGLIRLVQENQNHSQGTDNNNDQVWTKEKCNKKEKGEEDV
ncbi:MAG: helix-turn-helix transcriptional regulator [Anaerovoracaceae bacterium]